MIRGYTNIEQSRKLVEILPLESADMFYIAGKGEPIFIGNKMVACGEDDYDALGEPDVLCWSLAALLEIIPCVQVNRMANSDKWEASSWNDSDFEPALYVEDYDNPVDACYEMILKLHELTLL